LEHEVIVVGTTCAAFVMDDPDTWGAWIRTAEEMQQRGAEAGYPVHFFAAIEVDARGIAPFQPLLDRLAEVGGEYFTYSLDDGRTEVTTKNRLRHITLGQNIVTDYTISIPTSTHLLFMAADCEPPGDAIDKLLELDHALVGGEVSTYCLEGPVVDKYPFPVQEHMATAAFIMIRRDLLRFVRWRWDLETQMSDDPCLHYDALHFHGVPTYVRKDCIGRHYPESIGAVESRGHADMSVVRE
jgi:hypothetical protein